VRSVLCQCEIPVADLQHVRVRVAPEINVVHQEGVFVGDCGDAGPGCYCPLDLTRVWREAKPTVDIPRHAPRVPRFIAPGVHVRVAPVTQRVEDRAVSFDAEQRIAHASVPLGCQRGSPVVARRRGVLEIRTGPVGGLAAWVWDAVVVLVGPV
jgi:hypothetical protein